MSLPIHEIERDLLRLLNEGNRLVLTAPTGSGKSTRVPGMLRRLEGFQGEVVVLQPRRLAARLLARRVAAEMGVGVGEEVGYQTRFDSLVSQRTRIRFVTEGVFLRLLASAPDLPGFGAVILDEFHERHVAGDLALGLVKLLQESRRPDLKLVVMSATLAVEPITQYLDCRWLCAGGRLHPVDVSYLERPEGRPCWDLAGREVRLLLSETDAGHILVFMPGRYEIERTLERLSSVSQAGKVDLFPLYSTLPAEQQDLAVDPGGGRKVIVSTNVAETSITIEGVSAVVDSGLVRMARFSSLRSMNVLNLERVSASSAEQRAGRAGRTGPGRCVRLWSRLEQNNLRKQDAPEVLRLDLVDALLQLKSFGVVPQEFPWLGPPDEQSLSEGLKTLELLGALDSSGGLTPVGRQLAVLPMHPRLGRLLLEAGALGCLRQGALWAALASERNIFLPDGKPRFEHPEGSPLCSDFLVLEEAMSAASRAGFGSERCRQMGLSGEACRVVARTQARFLEGVATAGLKDGKRADPAGLGKALLAAFVDHVAALRSEGAMVYESYRSGRGVLTPDSPVAGCAIVAPVELHESSGARGATSRFGLATRIDPEWLETLYPERMSTKEEVMWDEAGRQVLRQRQRRFDHLVVKSEDAGAPDPGEAAAILSQRIMAGQLRLKSWDDEAEAWLSRVRCVAAWFPERRLIIFDDSDMRMVLEEFCMASPKYSRLENLPFLPALKSALSWNDRQFVERMAPERILLPRGWRMKMRYEASGRAIGRAKIQDLYDLTETPTVADGRHKVLLEILAPNFRPVQTTDDLAGFWANWYPKIRKQLSRRYPKHEWR